ncbi:MAG TPA: IPT/TIG domain-containing protein [Solirubrobacteraceae bacterium]|nr:IPT/TIG domain-containing protein [Solirubrobacteraceae bacterium]
MHGNGGARSRSTRLLSGRAHPALGRARSVHHRFARLYPALVAAVALALGAAPALGTAPASAAGYSASAWGYNGAGQLGNGTTTLSRTPVPVQSLSTAIALAAGGEHSLALLANNTMMGWGANHEGQLGTGSTAGSRVPVAISNFATLQGVTAIAAGKEFSLALLKDGTVLAWGANEEGQMGNGKSGTKVTSPTAVKGLSNVAAIAAGSEFALALLKNGTVMAWGAGGEGELGNGKHIKSASPSAVKGLTNVTAIAAGGEFALARLSNGKVMAWGSNSAAQLGAPPELKNIGEGEFEEVEVENSALPLEVQSLSGATSVAAGAEHSLALLADGEVMSWGGNESDQLGNGSSGGSSNMPTAVQGLSGVTAIAAGARHSLAILTGGSLVAWGYNPDGQLGNGSNLNSPVPVAVSGLGQVVGISGGGSHSLALGPPPPSVSGLNPTRGQQQGGTTVTITGVNFGEATAVHFGSSAASSFTVTSPTTIEAVSPPGTGTVDVTVTSPVSTSAPNPGDRFTYVPPPTVTKVKANKGPAAGGTTVTITGTDLTGASAVTFGTVPVSNFTVTSATTIEAVSPPGTSGPADVRVTTSSGTSPISTHDVFKYENPTISGFSPSSGPTAGGTSVAVSGSGFAPGSGTTAFKFGKELASSVQCATTTSCTLLTPSAKKPGTIEVSAAVGKTKSKKSPPGDQFTYE